MTTTLIPAAFFIVFGIACVVFGRSIALDTARRFNAPLRWLVGDKPWVRQNQQFITIYLKWIAYFGSVLAFTGAALTFVSLFVNN